MRYYTILIYCMICSFVHEHSDSIYIYIYMYMCVYIYVCMYVYVYVYIYIYIVVYIRVQPRLLDVASGIGRRPFLHAGAFLTFSDVAT